MSEFASLFAATLLLASSPAWAEADRAADLTYCLDLKSNEEIAKCAGEISAGDKGKPLSRAEVEQILSKEQARAPDSKNGSAGTPAADESGKESLPEKTGSNSNY